MWLHPTRGYEKTNYSSKKATTEINAQHEGAKLTMIQKKLGSWVVGLQNSKSLFLFGCSDELASPACSIHWFRT